MDTRRRLIQTLYLDQELSLEEVMTILQHPRYGIPADANAYKRAFNRWGISKNIPKAVMLYMLKRIDACGEHVHVRFFWHDRPVDPKKVRRIQKRYLKPNGSLTQDDPGT